jgi:hypothetical protein
MKLNSGYFTADSMKLSFANYGNGIVTMHLCDSEDDGDIAIFFPADLQPRLERAIAAFNAEMQKETPEASAQAAE